MHYKTGCSRSRDRVTYDTRFRLAPLTELFRPGGVRHLVLCAGYFTGIRHFDLDSLQIGVSRAMSLFRNSVVSPRLFRGASGSLYSQM